MAFLIAALWEISSLSRHASFARMLSLSCLRVLYSKPSQQRDLSMDIYLARAMLTGNDGTKLRFVRMLLVS
jgi:hypothetical protein